MQRKLPRHCPVMNPLSFSSQMINFMKTITKRERLRTLQSQNMCWNFSNFIMLNFSECFGFDSLKKYNINLLDDQTMIYSVGVTYNILNIQTKEI